MNFNKLSIDDRPVYLAMGLGVVITLALLVLGAGHIIAALVAGFSIIAGGALLCYRAGFSKGKEVVTKKNPAYQQQHFVEKQDIIIAKQKEVITSHKELIDTLEAALASERKVVEAISTQLKPEDFGK